MILCELGTLCVILQNLEFLGSAPATGTPLSSGEFNTGIEVSATREHFHLVV